MVCSALEAPGILQGVVVDLAAMVLHDLLQRQAQTLAHPSHAEGTNAALYAAELQCRVEFGAQGIHAMAGGRLYALIARVPGELFGDLLQGPAGYAGGYGVGLALDRQHL